MREMKDSGIEWIGTIPFDWKCCKQKYEIQLINGRAYSDSEFEEDGKYRILRVGNLFSNPTWYTSSLELPPDKYCENGDLLYSWSMSYAPVIWSGEKVIYHYHIWKTKLSSNLNKKFAYYYLSALTDALKAKIHETTMGFITMGVMNNSYIAFPCLKEQEKIVSFLDSQCSEIDALSADIQKEIETLERYKRSVITEAVTKGLNPDVEMKDSQTSWFGNIPQNWSTCKTLYVLKQPITDGPHTTPELYDEGIPFVSAEAVSCGNGDIDFEHIRGYISQEFYDECCKKYIPQKYDIYMIKSGATTGKVAIVTTEKVFTIWSPLAAFRCDENKMLPYFLYYSLQATPFQNQVQDGWNYGTQQNIGMRTLEKLKICKPPLTEQKQIVDYLNKKCSETNIVIKELYRQLKTLASYKESIIYEYVTGKKEVLI